MKKYIITTGEYDDYGFLYLAEGPDNLDVDKIKELFKSKENIEEYFISHGLEYREGKWGFEYFYKVSEDFSYWRTFWASSENEYIEWLLEKFGLKKIDSEELHI